MKFECCENIYASWYWQYEKILTIFECFKKKQVLDLKPYYPLNLMNLFTNPILEISISLILIYALLSILSSILVEWWNHYRKSRGKLLQDAIFQLLDDPYNLSYGDLLMNHFLIKNLRNPHNRRPAQYISSNLFAEALIDSGGHAMKLSFCKTEETESIIGKGLGGWIL